MAEINLSSYVVFSGMSNPYYALIAHLRDISNLKHLDNPQKQKNVCIPRKKKEKKKPIHQIMLCDAWKLGSIKAYKSPFKPIEAICVQNRFELLGAVSEN